MQYLQNFLFCVCHLQNGHYYQMKHALRAEISLTCFNARTSFQTNASTSTIATMNNQLWLNFSPSVMNKFPGVVVINSGDAGQPVKTVDI